MLRSSHSKRAGSRMSPYLMISLTPDASSRSGSEPSVSTSTSTHLFRHGSSGSAPCGHWPPRGHAQQFLPNLVLNSSD